MKRLCKLFLTLSLILLLSSCNLNMMFKKPSSQTSTPTTVAPTTAPTVTPTVAPTTAKPTMVPTTSPEVIDYSAILNSYKTLKKYRAYETTSIVDKNGQADSATRVVDVDYNSSYVLAKINHNDVEGSVKYVSGNYYYAMGDDTYTVEYLEANNQFTTLGINKIFDLEYKFTGNVAKKMVTNQSDSALFDNLYQNVNMDLETKYAYNSKSFVTVTITFTKDKIDNITFDLGYIYGSFYSKCTRVIKFSDESFNKETLDLSSGNKYYVNTDSTLNTYVIEMVYEYGDSIFIKSGDFDMLIDAGQSQDGYNVKNLVNNYCTDKILDMLIITHGHADHYGGFNHALEGINQVSLFVDYGYVDSRPYESLRTNKSLVKDYYSAYDSVHCQNGAYKIYRFSNDLSIEIINTGLYAETGSQFPTNGNPNEYSVVCKVNFKNTTYLYTGDLAGQYEENIKKEDIKDIDVYKVAHHGASSESSNTASFINYLNPNYAVISTAITNDGQNNPAANTNSQYHPTKAVVSRLLAAARLSKNKNVYLNATMGTICLTDSGNGNINVTGFGAQKGYMINGVKVTGEENLKLVDTKFYAYR